MLSPERRETFIGNAEVLEIFNITKVGKIAGCRVVEGKVEREESLGINKITDLTYKGILDLYTCTECGRCSDNCPAFITNKKLSPKHLTLALRNHLYDTEEAMFGKGDTVTDPKDDAAPAPSDDVVEMPRPRAPTSRARRWWTWCRTSCTRTSSGPAPAAALVKSSARS